MGVRAFTGLLGIDILPSNLPVAQGGYSDEEEGTPPFFFLFFFSSASSIDERRVSLARAQETRTHSRMSLTQVGFRRKPLQIASAELVLLGTRNPLPFNDEYAPGPRPAPEVPLQLASAELVSFENTKPAPVRC